jgi:hypothetical protein
MHCQPGYQVVSFSHLPLLSAQGKNNSAPAIGYLASISKKSHH